MHRTLVGAALASCLSAQSFSIQSTVPAAHQWLGTFDPIVVTFTTAADPSTVNAQSFRVFGKWTGAVDGTIQVAANGLAATFRPSRPMLLGDTLRVELCSSILSAAGQPLSGGHHFHLPIQALPSSGSFTQTGTIQFRAPGEGSISTYGIHAGDVDRDGVPDVTAINERSHDLRVFKSDGCGALGPVTLVSDGVNWPSPHASADFDGDGWMDLVTGDYAFGNVSVFLNDGVGNYSALIGLSGGSFIRSIVAADFDGDGAPDIAAGNGGDVLVWLNDGTGGFSTSTSYGQPGAEINAVDANGDGWWDIVGSSSAPATCHVLLGNGDGTFSSHGSPVTFGGSPWATCAADVNGDGHVDVAVATLNPARFTWLRGDGAGGFTVASSLPAGGWPTSVHMADLEGDGDMDAVLSHYSSADFYIYWNDGAGNYSAPTVLPAVGGGACVTIADFDRDGDLDILGADEVVDVGLMFTQDGPPPPPGVQPPSCDAALRINQRGGAGGFAGSAPVPVVRGTAMAVNTSSDPNALAVMAVGLPLSVGAPFPSWGLLHLDTVSPIYLLPPTTLDLDGEHVWAINTPSAAPVGASLAVQSLVLSANAEQFSNPVRFVLVP